MSAPVVAVAALLALTAAATAQVPAQLPPPQTGQAEWQRPSTTTAEYTAGARQAVGEIEAKLPVARQRANETGGEQQLAKLREVERKLVAIRAHLDRLPQTDRANWDTVRKNFENAYDDLVRTWNEAAR